MAEDAPRLRCRGCGWTEAGTLGDVTDIAPVDHCDRCPPWTCETCGQERTITSLCPCWVNLVELPMADIKGLLVRGGFSVGGVIDG